MNIAVKCDLPGYCITEQIYAGTKTLVYRGIREFDQHLVVIKLLRNEYPSFSELVQFRNQYTIAKNLHSFGIIKPYSLELYGNSYALVMEDFGGVSLSKYARGQKSGFDVERSAIAQPNGDREQKTRRDSESSMIHDPLTIADFLAIALQLCDILSELYHHRIIHKDIKPANILINPETKQVKLIDFSIASLLPRETQDIQNPNGLEGTLAYLSPEQTGRMNRGIDYRSDYYSLGVTFFELLTGQLPFHSNDPMELVHCHIAKQPPACRYLNPTVPPVLSAIVSKLLAKNAEDRYQSALGLKHDLEQCLIQWQKADSITAFTLGQRDITDRFLIPEKLYGREQEVAALLSAFERVSGSIGSELILVAGFSGIGKTAIVNEVHKPIVRQRGYFIKGKYDQFQRDIPFSAFVQAFRDLMGQLLSESDLQLEGWKTKILTAVGESGQVLIEVIPELERIIGTQPIVPDLSGSAAQSRFNLLMQKFVQVFTTQKHPLVVFLDDLQWADLASLKLLRVLMQETEHLLVIGAYRNNEVSAAHPFMLTIAEMAKTRVTMSEIALQALSQDHLNQLIADALSCERAIAQPLTELVYQKTSGNPFFTTQFLKALYEDGQITFDWKTRYWQCDIAVVKSVAITDDVVEFMALQLQKLPAETQEILKLAACIGNQFDLATLAIVHEKSQTETASDLWKALQEGLILPQSDVYKFYQEPEATRQELKEPVLVSGSCGYKFLHDRVQQAAYSLIPDSQKQLTHFKIGQRLLDATPVEARDEKLFEIVNQLNQGASLIITLPDREQLATLNLTAGQKAKASTAYTSALDYAVRGIQLLTADGWQYRYSLTLALYELAAEVAFLSGDFEQMQQLAAIVLQQSQRLLDTIKIYEVKILAEVAQSRQPEAIKTALTVLERFGMEFPAQPSATDIEQSLKETQNLLAEKQLEELLNLPEMVDLEALAVIQLLAAVTAAVYQAVPALLPLIVCQQVKLSAQHGNATVSTLAYAWYGVILCTSGEIDLGNRVGQLALDLLAQSKHQGFKASTINMVYPFVKPWKYALRESLAPLLEGYHSGLEMGALEYAAYCAYNYCALSFFMGKELVALESETAIYGQSLAQLKQEVAYNYLNVFHQSTLNLSTNAWGKTQKPWQFQGTAYDEATMLPLHQIANDLYAIGTLSVNKLLLCYLFQAWTEAIAAADCAQNYLDGVAGSFMVPIFHFYDSLTQLATLRDRSELEQQGLLDRVSANQQKLRHWADHAPINHLHKFYLVEAEHHCILGNRAEAIDLYDRAITGAKTNGFIQEEALANELAARFYLDWGKERIAQDYITEAYYAYSRWGAAAKVHDLEQRYPELLAPILQQRQQSLTATETIIAASSHASKTSTSSSASETLDLAAVLKVSQTLSSEIELDKLVFALLEVVVESAGAQKCALMLLQDDCLMLIAVNSAESCPMTLHHVPVEESQEVPISLINRVKRTLEPIVIMDAIHHPSLASDLYIQRHQSRSVLCTPIIHQSKLLGILYLENNLVTGAFTSDRVELLNLLCAQAAISLENARLYQQSQQMLAELSVTKARFQRLADNVPGIIYQVRLAPDGSVSMPYVSSGCIELFEGAPEEFLAGIRDFRSLEHPEDRSGIDQAMHHSAQTLTPFKHEWRIITPSGTVKWVQAASRPERQADGSIIWDGVKLDISDRKRAEAELHHRTGELEQTLQELQSTQTQMIQAEKMSSLGQLVAGVAHEINNPVNFIYGNLSHADDYIQDVLGLLELYQQYSTPHPVIEAKAAAVDLDFLVEDLPKLLSSMRVGADRIQKIVASLRTFSRMDESEMKAVDIHQGIDSTLMILQHRLKARSDRSTIEVVKHYDSLPLVECYAGQLNQVFMNMLSNAIDAIEEELVNQSNSSTPTITIRTQLIQPNQVKICIADSGAGMPEPIRKRLFKPFFTTKPVGKGTGMGLSISYQIVAEKHGGSLSCQSELGQGTEFIIQIPLQQQKSIKESVAV